MTDLKESLTKIIGVANSMQESAQLEGLRAQQIAMQAQVQLDALDPPAPPLRDRLTYMAPLLTNPYHRICERDDHVWLPDALEPLRATMTYLDYVGHTLQVMSPLAARVIVVTTPEEAGAGLFHVLQKMLPDDVKLIAGVPVNRFLPRGTEDPTHPDVWSCCCKFAEDRYTGCKTIYLECETLWAPFYRSQNPITIDLDRLRESLKPLADTPVQWLVHGPWFKQFRAAESASLVNAFFGAVPNSTAVSGYLMCPDYGRNASPYEDERQAMLTVLANLPEPVKHTDRFLWQGPNQAATGYRAPDYTVDGLMDMVKRLAPAPVVIGSRFPCALDAAGTLKEYSE